jgi:hypothetical protein
MGLPAVAATERELRVGLAALARCPDGWPTDRAALTALADGISEQLGGKWFGAIKIIDHSREAVLGDMTEIYICLDGLTEERLPLVVFDGIDSVHLLSVLATGEVVDELSRTYFGPSG